MARKQGGSQWKKYLKKIKKLIKDDNKRNPILIAKQINEEYNLHLNKRQLDLLRMYISRERTKQGLPDCTRQVPDRNVYNMPKDNTTWDENLKDGTGFWEYDGTQSITSLEQAIAFSGVDESKWEVERHIFNSWDVIMKNSAGKPVKRTNYQVKVWFRAIEEVEIAKPVFRNIKKDKTKSTQMWVIIGCVHRPFHDKKLWDKFLYFLQKNKKNITGIIINGDFGDLRSLSSHDEWIPEGIDLAYEYSDMLQGIHDVEMRLNKNIDKIFHYGNHEDRFFRDKKSIRKYGRSLPAPHEAMELEERGWDLITDWKNGYTTLGNSLDVFHGTKIGINAAKDQLQAIPNRDHIFNHTHRFGTHSNKTNTAYNTGCMIDFEHEVFKYTDRGIRESWSQGFAVVYIDDKGNNHVSPIKVDNDKSFFFEGLVY
jgi:hypothetical protein